MDEESLKQIRQIVREEVRDAIADTVLKLGSTISVHSAKIRRTERHRKEEMHKKWSR